MKQQSYLIYLLCLFVFAGCEETTPLPIASVSEGGTCSRTSDCIAGFECVQETCQAVEPIPDRPYRGTVCSSNQDCACPDNMECGETLYCGTQDLCTISEGLEKGELCGLSIDCKAPLYCNGFTSTCSDPNDTLENGDPLPGRFQEGETCENILDCRRPLVCDLEKKCSKLPFYQGASCSRSNREQGAFRAYFELPNPQIFDDASQVPKEFEFYRLPYPSNIRVHNGKTSLAGHASPGEAMGINVQRNFFATLEQDVQGFGISSPVFFRFSDLVDPESVCLDPGSIYPEIFEDNPFEFSQLIPNEAEESPEEEEEEPTPIQFCKNDGSPNIFAVNLDAQEETRASFPLQLQLSSNSGQYICGNWLGVAPLDGTHFEHNTTYAIVILSSIRSKWNDVPIQDRDFEGILSGKIDNAAMSPLLDWLDQNSIPAEDVAAATVFTTSDPDAIAPKLRQAVHNLPAPNFNNDTYSCDDGGANLPCQLLPCRQNPHPKFYEVRGTYPNPIFQKGTRPYKTIADGGDIERDSDGNPMPSGLSEEMCYSAAIPKPNAMPSGGWPVVIYAHGTGGSFASLTQTDTMLSQIITEAGYVAISFDNVMHGRRQSSDGTISLETLIDAGQSFFNLGNPRASRDNVLQGSADLFHLVRLLTNDVSGLSIPGNSNLQNIQINPDKIIFLGHSQGTVIASAFLAAETDIDGAILSGAGADLMLSILNKTSPIDMSTIAGFFFGDTNLTRIHPIMGHLSSLFSESDMLSYAPTYVTNPLSNRTPSPLLLFSGIADSFTPIQTHNALMRAAGLPIIGELQIEVPGVAHNSNSQVSNNLNGTTAGALQFTPTGAPGEPLDYDGHFIIYYDSVAQESIRTFLTTAKTGPVTIKR